MKSKRTNFGIFYVLMIAALVILISGSVELDAMGQEAAMKGGTFAKDFIPTWQRAKDYSLKFAEAMPEEHYKFKPTPEIMSYGEQLVHFAGATFWFASKVKGEKSPVKEFKAEEKSKAEIIAFLKDSFAYAEKAVAGLSDEEAAKEIPLFGKLILTKAQTLMTIRDHVTHHRGQMVIYLRLKNIKPPEYVGW